MEFTDIRKALDAAAHKPICLLVAWDEGGAHFVAISGYEVSNAGIEMVVVDDPFWGRSLVPYAELCARYLGAGTWTTSYSI